jgi:hypothetical protein
MKWQSVAPARRQGLIRSMILTDRRWGQIYYLGAALASGHLALAWVQDATPLLNLRQFAAGQEKLPYQYRALTAWILRPLEESASLSRFVHGLSAPLNDGIMIYMALIAFLSVLASTLITQKTILHFTGDVRFSRVASFLVIYMSYFNYVLGFRANYFLPYDFPALFFFCAGFYCIVTRRMTLYYIVFVLSVFNKETSCFLTLIYLAYEASEQGRSWRRMAMHTVAQAAIWVAAKYLLFELYGGERVAAQNLGDTSNFFFQTKVGRNLVYLAQPQHWPTIFSTFGYLWIVLLVGARRIVHPGLRNLLPVIALWMLSMFVFGIVIEIRVYGEMISVVAVLVAVIIYDFLQSGWLQQRPIGSIHGGWKTAGSSTKPDDDARRRSTR